MICEPSDEPVQQYPIIFFAQPLCPSRPSPAAAELRSALREFGILVDLVEFVLGRRDTAPAVGTVDGELAVVVLAAQASERLYEHDTAGALDALDRAIDAAAPVARPIRTLLSIPTFRWIVGSGLTFNFATYAINGFIVPLLQRHYGLPIGRAAIYAGLITGATGLVGLATGGWIADRLHQRSEHARLRFCAPQLHFAFIA